MSTRCTASTAASNCDGGSSRNHRSPTIGSSAGDCAPTPSHTTGHTVFRIRRLNPAALPSCREIRRHHKPITQQSTLRQGRVHHRPRRDEPSAASRRHIAQHPLGHAQAPQSAAATPHTVPPQPKAFPDVPPDPTFQFENPTPILGQSVIPPPADHVPPPLGRQLPTRRWAAAAPDLPNLLLESRDTFPCYFPLLASVDAKPRKLARRGFSSAATRSIRSSCIAFCREFRFTRPWGPPVDARRGSTASASTCSPVSSPHRARTFRPGIRVPLGLDESRSSSFAPWSFRPSLQRHYPPSSLLWLLLTSPSLSRRSSPQVRR